MSIFLKSLEIHVIKNFIEGLGFCVSIKFPNILILHNNHLINNIFNNNNNIFSNNNNNNTSSNNVNVSRQMPSVQQSVPILPVEI